MVFLEETYSVLLISASEKLNATLMALLPGTEYYPVTVAGSVSEAKRRLLEREYDIVLINAPLPDDFGMQLAMDVCHRSQASVLLLVKRELYDEIYYQAVTGGVVTLSKPTSAQMITQTLHVLCATRERMRHMAEKQVSVEEKIQEIRLINRAKWLLIEQRGMTEAEAHRYIEKRAMDTRRARTAVAEELLSGAR